jgi:hypothetical protein
MTIKSRFPNSETRKLGLLMTDEQKIERIQKWNDEDFEIMLKLCEEHGVTSWYELALKLAKECYKEPKKKGRKTKWTDYEKGVLVVEIERLSKDKKNDIKSAAKKLSRREPWKSFVEAKNDDASSPDPAETLRKEYNAFRNNKWAKTFRDAYSYYVDTNKIDEWEKQVLEINLGEN